MEHLYFAYGSNLDVGAMKRRCPEAEGIGPAVLDNWRLAERYYADIEASRGDRVHGVLYAVTDRDLAMLDVCEGCPELYERIGVEVVDAAGASRTAWVYTMTAEYKRRCGAERYPAGYRAVCAAGAEFWGIPNAFGDLDAEG